MAGIQKWTGREARALREALRMSGRDFAERLGMSGRAISKWESPTKPTTPRADSQAILDTMLAKASDEERERFEMLLAGDPPEAAGEESVGSNRSQSMVRVADITIDQASLLKHGSTGFAFAVPALSGDLGTVTEWPVWFGVRVSHLIGLVDNWRQAPAHLDSLQTLLHREILMFDATGPDDNATRALHALSRRQALVTLAALPMTLTASSPISTGALSPSAATDFFLSRCTASLTACWHLMRGSDLSTVSQMLSSYLLALESIAQKQSGYQQAAARLASQAHRICGIVALHRDQLRVREHHCKQALYFATVASDASSRASALISLASTYFYDANPARAAEVYEQASTLESGMSTLQRSRVYAELSVVYGQLSREREAVRATGLAEELYPDNPEQDPSFLYAEFTPASLSLESGLAYAALAEKYPGRGYQNKAAEIFARVDEMTSAVPDRIRFEVVNHQARTAVLRRDLDAFEEYMNRGIEGVVLLGSGQRRREMQAALRMAARAWPRDKRVKTLSDGVQLAIAMS